MKKRPKPKLNTNPAEPSNARDLKFCERWLVHRDHIKAYEEAGFSLKSESFPTRSRQKLMKFQAYLDRRIPKVEAIVAKEISYERADILAGIARIANANALDYIVPYAMVDEKTGAVTTSYRPKALGELTREEAAALDTVSYNAATGLMTYTLPPAKTRLSAFRTLGEQAAGFSKKTETHNHLHLADVPLDQLRHIKGLLIDMVGTSAARQVFGLEYDGAPETTE